METINKVLDKPISIRIYSNYKKKLYENIISNIESFYDTKAVRCALLDIGDTDNLMGLMSTN